MQSEDKTMRNQWIRVQFSNGMTMTKIASEVGISVEHGRHFYETAKKAQRQASSSLPRQLFASALLSMRYGPESNWKKAAHSKPQRDDKT